MCHASKNHHAWALDVIVTTSPSVAKPSVVSIMSIPVFSTKLLKAHAISTGSTAEVPKPSRKCPREESVSLVASRHEPMVAFEMFKGLKATNERQDDGTAILHQVAQNPIDQVYSTYI